MWVKAISTFGATRLIEVEERERGEGERRGEERRGREVVRWYLRRGETR